MTMPACVLLALGPVFNPGPPRATDVADPRGIEVAQIERHLAHVEAALRRSLPSDATPAGTQARERALDALHAYWKAGVFPKNRDFADRRVPYFIDADGTVCAVGHLMLASGDRALAREIATYENNDFLADIDHPGVAPWLARNGLTAEEAAWIQPTYGPCGPAVVDEPSPVCGADGRSYECEYFATECAMVEVQAMGLCAGDDDYDLVHPECPGEPTESESESESVEGGGTRDDDDKSCRVGGRPSLAAFIPLLVVLGRRRSS